MDEASGKSRLCLARSPPEDRAPPRFEVKSEQRSKRFDRAKTRLPEITPLVPFRKTIHELETARRQWGTFDGQAAAGKVADLAADVKQVREHLPKPGGKQVAPAVAMRAARTVRELQDVLKRWCSFYEGCQPDFAWWLKKPCDDASKQLEDYAKQLREEIAGRQRQGRRPAAGRADRGRGPGCRQSR